MILAGLDEAALGPKLGPFCACLTRFRFDPGKKNQTGPGEQLFRAVSNDKKNTEKITVGDSKLLYSADRSGRGLAVLEEAVVSFLKIAGYDFPENFEALVELLAGSRDLQEMKRTPWFIGAAKLNLPVTGRPTGPEAAARCEALEATLGSSGVTVFKPEMRFIPADQFNREIAMAGGKGGAVANIIGTLIVQGLNSRDEPVEFTVDRQGGRRYYGEWLLNLFPGTALSSSEEGHRRSAYSIGPHSLEFLVKADAERAEVALASMFAKYLREVAMILFNQWWKNKVPDLRPTAGYPEDARRFIADLEGAGALPEDRETLIRNL